MTTATLSRLIAAFRRYRLHVGLLIVLGFLSGILEGIGISAVVPLFALIVGEQVEGLNTVSTYIIAVFQYLPIPYSVTSLLFLIVFFFSLRAVVVVLFNYMRTRISMSFMVRTMNDVLDAMLKAEWGYLLKQRLGYAETLFLKDIRQTAALLESASQGVLVLTSLVVYVFLALNISPLITCITGAVGVVLLLLLHPVRNSVRHVSDVSSSTEKNIANFVGEHILGMKTVKAAGVERAVFEKGILFFDRLKNILVKSTFVQSMGTAIIQPISLMFIAVVFLYFNSSGAGHIGSFVALVYLIQKIFVYVEGGQSALHSVYDKVPYAMNVLSFRDALKNHPEKISGKQSFVFKSSLSFENVRFSYTEAREVLNDVSFKIKKGEMVGLIGPSGAGKTSIADLLLRLFHPLDGHITIDGQVVSDISLKEWRKNVGYVSQDLFLLNDTVRNNIMFYGQEVTRDDIDRAMDMANCRGFIEQLPHGLDTLVGERGVLLSAGQRQRIILARALARDPQILILDEATSALDNESEKLVHESIEALRGKVTMFVIAHRLSTITHVDSILVLKDGSITEKGSPEELMNNASSYFYKMSRIKDGDVI